VGKSGRGVKMTTHLQLVPRSRKRGSIHPFRQRLHGVVLNCLNTGTTLPFIFLMRQIGISLFQQNTTHKLKLFRQLSTIVY
jgi:hypothetical protein